MNQVLIREVGGGRKKFCLGKRLLMQEYNLCSVVTGQGIILF